MNHSDNQTIYNEFILFYDIVWNTFSDFSLLSDNKDQLKYLVPTHKETYFQLIGRQKSGSLICFWQIQDNQPIFEQPIVWLDSEGEPHSVFASDFRSFLSLLPYDTGGIYDMITAWERFLRTNEDWQNSIHKIEDVDLQFYTNSCRQNNSNYDQFIDWLKKMNIEPAPDPVSLIGNAIQQFPHLEEWLDE